MGGWVDTWMDWMHDHPRHFTKKARPKKRKDKTNKHKKANIKTDKQKKRGTINGIMLII